MSTAETPQSIDATQVANTERQPPEARCSGHPVHRVVRPRHKPVQRHREVNHGARHRVPKLRSRSPRS